MARRARRPPERGWRVDQRTLTLAATTVDNIVTVVDKILDFEDLIDADEDEVLSGQDKVADYYVEAMRGYAAFVADFGLGNETGGLPVYWGLLVGDFSVLDDLAGAAPNAQTFAVPFDTFRAFDFVRQVLSVNLTLASENYFPGERIDQGGRPWFLEWNTGPIHLKRGEGVFFYQSQTGNEDPFQPWVNADTVEGQFIYSALIRKKRAHQ